MRKIEPEWLDSLPSTDTRAVRSRRDLRRLNGWMGHARLMAGLLERSEALRPVRNLVELGAGDGTFLLSVARRLAPTDGPRKAMLIDRQGLLTQQTKAEFEGLGWTVEGVEADVFDWLQRSPPSADTAIVANLFLHHFETEQLRALLAQAALMANLFVACEPRRSLVALAASHLVGFIGCNGVTRHDARVSVRAGFSGAELSEVWPRDSHWQAQEGRTGLFSHFFVASR